MKRLMDTIEASLKEWKEGYLQAGMTDRQAGKQATGCKQTGRQAT